jgi:hypothetical protein
MFSAIQTLDRNAKQSEPRTADARRRRRRRQLLSRQWRCRARLLRWHRGGPRPGVGVCGRLASGRLSRIAAGRLCVIGHVLWTVHDMRAERDSNSRHPDLEPGATATAPIARRREAVEPLSQSSQPQQFEHSQFARVVKGVDLRSTGGNSAWVQTPQLTGPCSCSDLSFSITASFSLLLGSRITVRAHVRAHARAHTHTHAHAHARTRMRFHKIFKSDDIGPLSNLEQRPHAGSNRGPRGHWPQF